MRIKLHFRTSNQRIPVTFSENKQSFPVCFRSLQRVIAQGGEQLPNYGGPTSVLPSFARQVLPTKGTSVHENIEIRPIQVTVVSNTSGGKTISI